MRNGLENGLRRKVKVTRVLKSKHEYPVLQIYQHEVPSTHQHNRKSKKLRLRLQCKISKLFLQAAFDFHYATCSPRASISLHILHTKQSRYLPQRLRAKKATAASRAGNLSHLPPGHDLQHSQVRLCSLPLL